MAENKKSFILYCDIINTVQKLDDKTAGELFKHLLKYVNDEDPKTENILIDIAFEPIKQQLKRDLNKYQQIKQKRSQAGKRSAELRKVESVKQTSTNSTSVESVQQTSTNPTVTVNDTVNVTVNVNDINNIYNLYPSKCPTKGNSTGKCSKNKKQIESILKTKNVEELKNTIEFYLEDCKKHKTYLKNFSTFLNNLPEIVTDADLVFWRKPFEATDTYRESTKEEFNQRFTEGHEGSAVVLPKKPLFGKLIKVG